MCLQYAMCVYMYGRHDHIVPNTVKEKVHIIQENCSCIYDGQHRPS